MQYHLFNKPFATIIKPIYHTIKLELRVQRNKFIIFSLLTIIIAFLGNFISGISGLSWPLYYFYMAGLWWFIFTIAFSASFFFSGIICSDYKKKTGAMIIPLIKRYQFFMGKFISNYLYTILIAVIQYSAMYLFGFYYYGPLFLDTPLLSLMLVILYLLALGALISFFSSFLPSETYVIIITLALYFFGFSMIESLINEINPHIEPLFSLRYLYNIIVQIIDPNYSINPRFDEFTNEWSYPTANGAVLALSLQAIIFLTLTLYFLKKKQI
jgi:ABC-type transport system involved in multi-copper enzyme maturation permease subunit